MQPQNPNLQGSAPGYNAAPKGPAQNKQNAMSDIHKGLATYRYFPPGQQAPMDEFNHTVGHDGSLSTSVPGVRAPMDYAQFSSSQAMNPPDKDQQAMAMMGAERPRGLASEQPGMQVTVHPNEAIVPLDRPATGLANDLATINAGGQPAFRSEGYATGGVPWYEQDQSSDAFKRGYAQEKRQAGAGGSTPEQTKWNETPGNRPEPVSKPAPVQAQPSPGNYTTQPIQEPQTYGFEPWLTPSIGREAGYDKIKAGLDTVNSPRVAAGYQWNDMSRGNPQAGMMYGQMLTDVNQNDPEEVARWNQQNPQNQISSTGAGGGTVYSGGSQDFDERTGTYRSTGTAQPPTGGGERWWKVPNENMNNPKTVYGKGGGGDQASGYWTTSTEGQKIMMSNPGAKGGYDQFGKAWGVDDYGRPMTGQMVTQADNDAWKAAGSPAASGNATWDPGVEHPGQTYNRATGVWSTGDRVSTMPFPGDGRTPNKSLQANIDALVPPNKIVSSAWYRTPPDTQQYLLGLYEAAGYSASDVLDAIEKNMPGGAAFSSTGGVTSRYAKIVQ